MCAVGRGVGMVGECGARDGVLVCVCGVGCGVCVMCVCVVYVGWGVVLSHLAPLSLPFWGAGCRV